MSSNEWLPSAFDGLEGELRKREGLERAMTPPLRRALLKSCITYLRLLATSGEDIEVTADDAGRFLETTGLPANSLGNSAGCLFRGKGWEFTGRRKPSSRASNHRHENRIWRYRTEREEDSE